MAAVTDLTLPAAIALATGAAALGVWSAVCIVAFAMRRHEKRRTQAAFVAMAWTASLGMLASAVGSAEIRGLLDLGIPADALSFVASFGRGALLAGGVVFIIRWREPRDGE